MAGDGEQNSDQCVLKTIVGHLTAFSHVFRSDPKVAFMEFMYANKQVCHVALRQDLATYKNVAMGKLYQVTHLHPRRMLYRDGEAVRLLEATRETSFILSADNEEMVLEPSLNTCNYEGKVVEPCSSLGIYRLHDNNRLCLGFLLTFADVPLPSVGQTVSVYNCHLWRNKSNDRYDIVLCGRSSIVLHGESDKTLNSETSNFININLNCSYLNLLWVEKQLGHFEEKFSDPFLTENGIVCKSARELQEAMLIKTVDVYYPVKKEDIKERFITREFLFSPHQCIFSKPLSFTGAYLTFYDLWRQATRSYNLVSSKVWNYHLFHYTDGLVGLLSTNLISGCWTLSDATKGFLCVVTGDMENLMMLHGAVVLLIKCTIVTEVFKDTNFVYIYFTATDARIIHTFDSRAGNDCRLMKKKKRKDSVMTCHSDGYVNDSEKASTSDIIHAREGTKNKQRSGQFDVENIVGYNLVTKETVWPSKYTWLIVVHHKTAAVKPSQCALPMCCLLVSLIGRIHEVADGCNNSSQRQYLMLSGKLLQFVPLMSKDSLYMLSLPDNPAYHQFPLPCRLKLKSCALPDLQGVCLPEESTFLSVNMQKPGFLNLKADSYNVSDKILHEEVGQKELINVEGIISYRLHTNVKYDSEKKYIPGYGVPGMKNIVLKLDSTLACGEEISLYLSKWNFRAYPLGLVPGAQIRAMFVAKHTSYNSFHTYLQATELTAIEVLSVPQQMGLEIFHETCSTTSHDWGESCILTHQAEHAAAGSTLWGCVSMLKILKLTVVTSCTHCSSIFKSGCCVGCSTYPLSSKLSVSATSCMEDIFGKILIFMKDEQVHQYLGLSKQYWDVLTKLVSRDGSKIELPQNQWNSHDPIGKRVLQALVKAADKQQPRFHILCRKMKVNKEDARYEELPKLFCLALRRPKPDQLYSMHKTRMS